MDSYDLLPTTEITGTGLLTKVFIDLGISNFKDASMFVHNAEYGYNSNYEDKLIFFKEKKGSCTSKHAVIGGLAEELHIPMTKEVAIYKFTEEVATGANAILNKYNVPYVPMVHCYLVDNSHKFDLTEGNHNGKNRPIGEDLVIYTEKVNPFISRRDEYAIFKRVLKEQILLSDEFKGIEEMTVLRARDEAIKLLKKLIE